MINFLTGLIIGLILGVILGGFVVKWFNVSDTTINGKYKIKNGDNIDFKNIFKRKK